MTEAAESKHKPGKWNALHDSDGDFAIYDENSNLVAVTNSDSEIDAIRAQLISAAPELLEALARMLKHFSDQDGGLCIECGEVTGKGKGCDTCYVLESAEAAIQRAKGAV